MKSSLVVPDLSPADVEDLLEHAVIRAFPRNAIIINEGDDNNGVYFIITGAVRIFLADEEGNQIVISTMGAGEYFGEMALEPGSRSASVMAMEPVRLAIVSLDDFRAFLRSHPDFIFSLLGKLIRRTRALNRNLKGMALLDVYGRLVQLLNDLAETVDKERVILEPLTQQEIASRIGCSRDMVSKIMKDLAAGDYLDISRKRIVIKRRLPTSW
ncbi:MAG TPA: Crp/Fnr family transcriptional regulator [Oxalobacteraceae bacterium]|nr:Crp/Fnr family transcriptional regulator [Oxalobacteraceae bacterium]